MSSPCSLSRRSIRSVGTLVVALSGVLAASCAREYANYPPIEGDSFAIKDVNNHNMTSVMAAALRWTALRYPPPNAASMPAGSAGPELFAINLPVGVSQGTYERVAALVGEGAVPVTEENAGRLPVYHVTRIWLRGTSAVVDVVRPLYEVGERPAGAGGGAVTRGVKTRLAGGWEPWRVTGSNEYEVGVLDAPELNFFENAGPGTTPLQRLRMPDRAPAGGDASSSGGEPFDPSAGETSRSR